MNILITGGTGSLGTELIKKLVKSNTYRKVCIYSRDEHKQDRLREQIDDPHEKLRFLIGDVRDRERLYLALNGINHVIHTAALKSVPAAEYNPMECVKTNIQGTQNLIDMCVLHAISIMKVLFVSTDKAVSPINLYGATKLCAEKLFMNANNINGPSNSPHFAVVRYGNVANSNGSVIPRFKRQIDSNKQLTLTDERMTRFWITLDEASDFVMNCLDRMYGGEVFVPDMPAFNVKDLALTMMKQYYQPENCFCEVIGTRYGEKLHEQIITKEEFDNCIYDKASKTYIINPPEYFKKTMGDVEEIRTDGVFSNSDFVNQLSEQGLADELEKVGALT